MLSSMCPVVWVGGGALVTKATVATRQMPYIDPCENMRLMWPSSVSVLQLTLIIGIDTCLN
jgi:hypothetical protein